MVLKLSTVNFGLTLKHKLNIWLPFIPFQKQLSTYPEHQKLISLLKCYNRTLEISQIHASMIKVGLDLIPFPVSKLLASCIFNIDYAASIFNQIRNPNPFMFNTMLRAYSISEDPKRALLLFNSIRAQAILLDQFSFISALKACARGLAIRTGQGIHALVVRCGYGFLINVRNTLLHLYCVCGRIEDAHQLFDEFPEQRDLVSWNALMGYYLHTSQPSVVRDLFIQVHKGGFVVSTTTIVCALSACSDLRNFYGAESLHGHCIKRGFCSDLNVATAIISMYAKTGHMDSGRLIFDELPKKDVVAWNCIIDGYAKSGRLEESLTLLRLMKVEGIVPNSATLAGLLVACASRGSLAIGECIYEYITEEKLELDAVLGTALIDMFSKCGFLQMAINIFHRMETKDVKTWTTLIAGYGVHGQGRNAVQLLNEMEAKGVMPNEVTFLAVLNACSHGGLVVEGKKCFERMVQKYGFSPSIEHYGCMIDLLGRAGLLDEAYELIKRLTIQVDSIAWRALLAACRVHGNVELGEAVRRELLKFNNEHPTDSMLLLSTYTLAGRWSNVARLSQSIEEDKAKRKEVGCSSIEMDVNF
ncbi:PREDICTED: pentatricopeptide repeat-containing protein At1g26900, mitochondrial [Nelumbo nucifera]|uniref:Pentatricopeptide repeat-containing protein At1g26900, mitochondrial n=1 Tax=Nelumbo nucifera TaxID=4432 RepID=A0A1U7ZMF1_NELNU|nr:PREDICTED: pentatricopeptide repeat-containing protein At1g26900, mitochondrial [Nelumbo nucifera]XP_010249150.1 PREDICTED: pentatricopeptide repeat-containing protein At1g26900, mitochondrial [Nelumbo nucifera]XP_010249151.1 PREDICTED: pentatricopeptide repeat-containing protein At1g26900, mitochondrial [Nelumbo nucifera]